MAHSSLNTFHPVVAKWFTRTFKTPTPPQAQGWPYIAAGENVLMLAPTGSGKTLAAFLKCLDWLYQEFSAGRDIDDGVKILYISPLKALNNDIYRNLDFPLNGINALSKELGVNLPPLRTSVRSGDTPAKERRHMLKKPPHILITTPESLFLLLSSQANRILKTVRFVIIDEIHALFPSKRGAHLSLSLERLEHLVKENTLQETRHSIQRIGLSATIKPLEQAAAYLAGLDCTQETLTPRNVRIIDTGQRKELDLEITLPVPDLSDLPEKSIWPSVYRKLLAMVEEHRTTIIFANNRRLAERITANLNQLASKTVSMTHHGSISKEVRLQVESKLQNGEIPCIVSTSTLELGIDIGHIDLVVQIESPKEVGRGLQRVGRAGHVLGLPSKGRLIPKTRADLLETVVLLKEMKDGRVEASKAPINCLDVLAQQIVAMAAQSDWSDQELYHLIRGSYNYQSLSKENFNNLLSMLAGTFQTAEFVELRPRIYWDRTTGKISSDSYGRYLVYSSGGTIPDRGYFGVYMANSGTYLGELDEEFVYERRLNEAFVLGTSIWRIEEIRRDRVIVTPAKKAGDAMIPFWKAEQNGRSFELGRKIGAFLEIANQKLEQPKFKTWLEQEYALEKAAADSLESFLKSQKLALGNLHTDHRLIIEEFPDEVGEWKVLLHSTYGLKVHTILGLIIRNDWEARHRIIVQAVASDDGIMFHCPGGEKPPVIQWQELPLEDLEEKVVNAISETALFGVTFRHAAQRALVLPRGSYGRKRNPLWLSRLKAGNLLNTVSKYRNFPLIVETYREILQDYFDLSGIRELITRIRQGEIIINRVCHDTPSPMAYAHLFNFVNNYMYENDAPKAERKVQLFGLGREALRSIVGEKGFRELFSKDAIQSTIAKAQGLDLLAKNPTPERVQYWLEKVGDIFPEEITAFFNDNCQTATLVQQCLEQLCQSGQVIRFHIESIGCEMFIPVINRDLYQRVFMASVENTSWKTSRDEAVKQLIRRFTRTHGPFSLSELSSRYGLESEEVHTELIIMLEEGLVEKGQFLPEGREEEWCDLALLKEIHRRSLSLARREVEPKEFPNLASLFARWQGMEVEKSSSDNLLESLSRLSYLWIPADILEEGILPSRTYLYRPGLLDQLISSGHYLWRARGSSTSFEIRFEPAFPQADPLLLQFNPQNKTDQLLQPEEEREISKIGRLIIELLNSKGALSLPQLLQFLSIQSQITSSVTVWQALEELLLNGMITNDSFGPIRYLLKTNPSDRIGAKGVLKPSLIAQMGRWSLLPPCQPEYPENQAVILLRRYGLVCREVAHSENLSWSSLYPIYDLLETAGKIIRGYFVQGLSGIQYALPEAVEMLRGTSNGLTWATIWDDPCNPARFFPEFISNYTQLKTRPYLLVYHDGIPIITSGSEPKLKLTIAPNLTPEQLETGLEKMTRLLLRSREKVIIAMINDKSALDNEFVDYLTNIGYEKGYKELTFWPSKL